MKKMRWGTKTWQYFWHSCVFMGYFCLYNVSYLLTYNFHNNRIILYLQTKRSILASQYLSNVFCVVLHCLLFSKNVLHELLHQKILFSLQCSEREKVRRKLINNSLLPFNIVVLSLFLVLKAHTYTLCKCLTTNRRQQHNVTKSLLIISFFYYFKTILTHLLDVTRKPLIKNHISRIWYVCRGQKVKQFVLQVKK